MGNTVPAQLDQLLVHSGHDASDPLMLSSPEAPIALCRASGASRRMLRIVDELAAARCATIGRTRASPSQLWRRVLGHLCATPCRTMKLIGHTNTVNCMVLLADGRIVSGSADRSLRLWDIVAGTCTMQLTGHTDRVVCMVQLADGRIVSGSLDSSLRVWDSLTGTCTMQLTGHTGKVVCVAQLADGRIVSGSFDSTLHVLDSMTGTYTMQVCHHTDDEVYRVVQLADGRIVSAGFESFLQVWS
mmetsp:Transcript_35738/g.114463  ORF Transcript_35738/g.114463 Transcript_35738/m.114463 type:complete len:244 (-) Transcript_35738:126-857(-)